MSCFPEGDGRERMIHAQGVLLSQAYVERISAMMDNTGACATCARSVCSTSLCKLLIKVFLTDYAPSQEEAERFEKGIVALCNSLIEKHIPDDDRRGHSSFTPSDN